MDTFRAVGKFSCDDLDKGIVSIYYRGYSTDYIARDLGVSEYYVIKVIEDFKIRTGRV